MHHILSQHNRLAAASSSSSSSVIDEDGNKKDKKKANSNEPSPAAVSLAWSNADLDLLVDPVRGAWESAKLHGPSLGPPAMTLEVDSPEKTDMISKLIILANYKAFYPMVGEAVALEAEKVAKAWLHDGPISRDGGCSLANARKTLKALLEAIAQVWYG